MSNLIEKFKNLDKRVQIGIGIGAAVFVILVIGLCIGVNNKPNENNNSQAGTENDSFIEDSETDSLSTEALGTENLDTETLGTETLDTELQGTEVTEEIESEDKNQNSNSEKEPHNNKNETNSKEPESEEILGQGTKDNPYLETPNVDNMTVTTVEIPAGKTVHYGIYRVSGLYLTIEDPNAYIIYDGKTYHASNGKVSLKVVSDEVASVAIPFEIGNKGTSARTFTIKFTNPSGTQMNPTSIDNVTTSGNSFDISIEAGNEKGYYYKYKAQTTGAIKFYISSFVSKTSGAEGLISVVNNKTSQQKTFNEEDVLKDENGNKYILMDVTAGDELVIIISTNGTGRVKYPAADIKWVAQYQ